MNDLQLEHATTGRKETSTRKKKGNAAFLLFIGIWILLIGGGLFGAKLYTDKMQRDITADIHRQTSAQIADMQKAYDGRLAELETTYAGEITLLKEKIDALNELLTFTKDNADSKTDNSNKLYTQLNEVKKQLNELKKSLDVLK
ncbi:hypothetical protein D3P07_11840 [Paenibacillus sp. 1011MAR3C5]|uniref:hypothetical protein n=1 Tax=Paenibacillus sp. 1011MAR3C5 TaxID=1675787 RepID=UPI000E6BA0FB|nr:hypothetical protein [Paenibacillus sp. 1011MAR3C5]RJE88674.1 hypothetical protein D3P07_11840 [Paenibacillus sp. 1011MAR3C5]